MRDDVDRFEAERHRLLAEGRRRRQEIPRDFYAPWNPWVQFLRASRIRAAVRLLHKADVFPVAGDACLEVGYGSLGWLGELICWGVRETDLHGIEIDAERAARARDILPQADLRIGDASSLPWPSDSFRLVVASTVFTSILDSVVRDTVAKEITRVTAPGGALLWYDFAVNNPGNSNVRRVTRRELAALFPNLSGRVRGVTLAPPLARSFARSLPVAAALESIPFLCTHLIAVLQKGPRR